jgi:hypothetical protein
MLAVFAEVAGMGFLELLIDPIVGSAMILTTVAFMIPTHILFSKMVAKMTIRTLTKRQKQLHLTENLITLFEKNITFSRMMLPINEPVGWNKKSKAQLANLLSKAKDLVQSLNDNFSIYNSVSASTLASISPTITQSERSISPTITMSESVISTTIPQTSTPQRQSALMQKILKK